LPVSSDGHNIPAADIERRFSRSLYNLFNGFSAFVDDCQCFISLATTLGLVFEQQGDALNIINPTWYQHLLKESNHE
jgi:predicted ABC-type ATPase